MFNNLIESGSHRRDLKRKGSFFIGTFLFYAALLMVAGVGSIYAYSVRLDEPTDYDVTIMRFPAAAEKTEPVAQRRATPKAAAASGGKQQTAIIEHLAVNRPLPNRQVAPEGARVLPPNMPYKFGDHTYIPPAAGGVGGTEKGIAAAVPGGSDLPFVEDTEKAPEVKVVKPAPTPAPEAPKRKQDLVRVTSTVLAGKAVAKPVPPYPPIAKQARQEGTVAVQIVVDEQGRVVSAKAASGPALLLAAAERAAYQARFSPTMLNGQPVKISGVITYNFILQ